jgi:isoquinoline 1-oxidoreductase beta subunit
VATAASKIEPPADIKLKNAQDWKVIGKGVKRLDTLLKVKGEAIYGIDVKLPGCSAPPLRPLRYSVPS